MKILVAEFHQETNSFNARNWTLDDFRKDTVLFGDDILADARQGKRILSGIVSRLDAAGAQLVAVAAYRSTSGGPVCQDIIESFAVAVTDACKANPDAVAVVLGLHGATQGTVEDDACGYILSRIRECVGPDVVIAAGCDFHANVTPRCIENADFICGFQTYPHVDSFHTGERAAALALEKLAGEKKYTAYSYLPMIVPASGYNTNEGTMAEVIRKGHAMVESGQLEDFTVFQMQPWLDVPVAGSAVVAVSRFPESASDAVYTLSRMVFDGRDEYWPELEAVDDVIRYAAGKKEGTPVLLVDYADSPGGGGFGDNVSVLSHLKKLDFPVRTAMAFTDEKSVDRALAAGVGSTCVFSFGNGACELEALVISSHDGHYTQEGPVGPNQKRNLGRTVVLRAANVDMVVCDHLCGMCDVQIYKHFGVDPSDYRMVCAKANTSYRGGFSKITTDFHMADTEGVNSARLTDMPFRKIPRAGFYPFDHLDGYKIPKPVVYLR